MSISVEMLPGFGVSVIERRVGLGPGRMCQQARVKNLGRKRKLDVRRVLAGAMETEVKCRLADLGYTVTGTSHNAHFDLLVGGVRVEVKASLWNGRYQANLRDNRFDVLVIGCLGADDLAFFVIPADQVRGISNVKIPSRDVTEYQGRFAPFLGAWDVIERAIQAGVNTWQMTLPL
jgi:hypothetical protein